MPIHLVNPLDETPRARGAPARRLDTLAGKKVGLLDISKPGGSIFLDRLERALREDLGVAEVVRAQKPTFAKPARSAFLQQLLDDGCDAVVEALAD